MGHASVKLRPGVNQNETFTLNEAGISTSNLVRFTYDPTLGALVQKYGGWSKFYPDPLPTTVRALWAWEDINNNDHLAYGTQTIVASGAAQLGVITDGDLADVTPRYATSNIAAVVSSTSGSDLITITDTTTTGITRYDSVYITTHIAIGGVVLFGLYPCDPDGSVGATTYKVQSVDILGNSFPAPSSSSSPVLPLFTTVSANPSVTITLPAHGYSAGGTFTVLMPTTVGGVTFEGEYTIQSIIDVDNFTIIAATTPTSSTSGRENNNNAHFIYSFGVGAISSGSGYGIGTYGGGGYGTGTAVTPSTGTPITAEDWSLANWGSILLASPIRTVTPAFQPIYQWDPQSGSPIATILPYGPTVNDGFFVAMPQRQIVAWGSTFDGVQDNLLVRWCDVGNYNSWIGTVINQAGSYRLTRGSRIVGAIQGPQQGIIWTDIDVWSMQYIGPPYVYSFNEIGSGCGLIARKAAASLNGSIFWMGPSQFYTLNTDGVLPVPCAVWDAVFQNMDTANLSKIRVAVNSLFNEISWFFPSLSGGTGEIDTMVKFNPLLNTWDVSTLGRTAWVDQSVLGPPIGADVTTNYLYQHETSPDADGQPLLASFQTGYYAMNEGDNITYVDQMWPDMKWGYSGGTQNATVNISFQIADYPGSTTQIIGPYSVMQSTQYISPRFRGRLVSLIVGSSDLGSFWRIGGIRYRLAPDGKF